MMTVKAGQKELSKNYQKEKPSLKYKIKLQSKLKHTQKIKK